MDYDRWDALLHHIFKQTQGDAWFRPEEESLTSGAVLFMPLAATRCHSRRQPHAWLPRIVANRGGDIRQVPLLMAGVAPHTAGDFRYIYDSESLR